MYGKWLDRYFHESTELFFKLFLVFCCTNINIFKLAWSSLFPTNFFHAPISPLEKQEMLKWGLVITTFFEDIPSILVQVLFIIDISSHSSTDTSWRVIALMSLLFSLVNVLSSIVGARAYYHERKKHRISILIYMRHPKKNVIHHKHKVKGALKKKFRNVKHFDVLVVKGKDGYEIKVIAETNKTKMRKILKSFIRDSLLYPDYTEDKKYIFFKTESLGKKMSSGFYTLASELAEGITKSGLFVYKNKLTAIFHLKDGLFD
eukprot:UN30050